MKGCSISERAGDIRAGAGAVTWRRRGGVGEARVPRPRGVLPQIVQHRLGCVHQGQGGGRRQPILRNDSTRQQRGVRMCQNKTPG